MSARQKDLRPARLLAHIINVSADPLPLPEAFARQQLVAAQHRLGAAEVDHDIAEFDTLNEPVDDLSDSILELEELPLTLGVSHLLDDNLLGRLCRDPTKIDRRQRVGNKVTDLGLRVQPLRLDQSDLRRLVLDGLRHLAEAKQPDLAIPTVDLGANIVLLAVFRAARLLDCLLHGFQHLVAIDAFVAGDGIGDLKQFGTRVCDGGVHATL